MKVLTSRAPRAAGVATAMANLPAVMAASLVRYRFDFLKRGHPLPDLEQPRLAEIAKPFRARLGGDVQRTGVLHQDARHLLGDRQHFEDADPTLVAGAFALLATDG